MTCFACGSHLIVACYRLPGLLSSLPPDRRGYLRACAERRDAAEARWMAATTVQHAAPVAAPVPTQSAFDL